MDRFAHLRIADSDSDSSDDQRSPSVSPGGADTAPPSATPATAAAAPVTDPSRPTGDPDALHGAGSPLSAPPKASAPPSSRHSSVAGSAALASCKSSAAAPPLASASSSAASRRSSERRGLPGRSRATPGSSVGSHRTPVDQQPPLQQPLSIAKEEQPTNLLSATDADSAGGHPAEPHHRALLSRTPTSSYPSENRSAPAQGSKAPSDHRSGTRSSVAAGSDRQTAGRSEEEHNLPHAPSAPAHSGTDASSGGGCRVAPAGPTTHSTPALTRSASSAGHSVSAAAAAAAPERSAAASAAGGAAPAAAAGTTAAAAAASAPAPKAKKASTGCGLFSFCRRKKAPEEAEVRQASERDSRSASITIVPASQDASFMQAATPLEEQQQQQQPASVRSAVREVMDDTPIHDDDDGVASAAPSSLKQSSRAASLRVPTPHEAVAHASSSDVAAAAAAVPLLAGEEVPPTMEEVVSAPGGGSDLDGPQQQHRKKRRIRVRKQRGSDPAVVVAAAAAPSTSPSERHTDASASEGGSSAATHKSKRSRWSDRVASEARGSGDTPNRRTLLDARRRPPTPNDVLFPVPTSDDVRGPSSTAQVRTAHTSCTGSDASSFAFSQSPSAKADDADDGSGHVVPGTTDGAGLTADAYDLLTNEREEPISPIRSDTYSEAFAVDPDEDLRHLPPYQRRLIADLRRQQRRELEEVAKEWNELTFHPVINPSPQYTIRNKSHFSERLSRSPHATPGAHSLSSGAATSGGWSPRRGGRQGTYQGEPVPSFAPEISAYAQSRPSGPGTVFDRLLARPSKGTTPAPQPTTDERECSFTPAITDRAQQTGTRLGVFERLTRPSVKSAARGPQPSPSPRRRQSQGESVFDRLYRQRKTPNSSPQRSPQRLEHQPQITEAAHRQAANRTASESDFGERLYRGERSSPRRDHHHHHHSRDDERRPRRTPFYPSSSSASDANSSFASTDHRRGAASHSGSASSGSNTDDAAAAASEHRHVATTTSREAIPC